MNQLIAFGEIAKYLSSNPLTVFNSILLVLTGYLSYTSYIFQMRTGIRESLEQLEDIEIDRSKLRPILHSFKFSLLRGSKTIVQLKYYSDGRNPANANQPRRLFRSERYKLARDHDDLETNNPIDEADFFRGIGEYITRTTPVKDAKAEPMGIMLHIYSDDAVEIRRVTESILDDLYSMFWQGPDGLVHDLELEDHLQ